MATVPLSAALPRASLSDVLGDPLRAGAPLPLGPVLALVDVTSGRCASTFSLGPVVTGCFDDVAVFRLPRHADLVSVRADVIAVGRSSLLVRAVVHVDVLGKDGLSTQLMAKVLTTFVAVDDDEGMARKVHSRLEEPVVLDTPKGTVEAETLLQDLKVARKILSESDLRTLSALADTRVSLSALYDQRPQREVPVADTRVVIRKQFLPRHRNLSGVVFGGDILETLDAAAISCARRASLGTSNFATVAIKGLSFLEPVEVIKVLQVEAKVVASSQRFMGVVVRTFVDESHDSEDLISAHTGVFHMMSISEGERQHDGSTVGVEKVERKDDEHLAEFYRVMALPLPEIVKNAWAGHDDAYPAGNFVTY